MEPEWNWAEGYYRIDGGIKDPQAYYRSLQKGYGTKHPERINGYPGVVFGTGGTYVSLAVLDGMKHRGFKDFVYESLHSFRSEEYGDISEQDIEDNGEIRWIGNGNGVTGRYGYAGNPVRSHSFRFNRVLRIRTWKGNTWITLDTEPDLFILYSREDLADCSKAAGRPDGVHEKKEGLDFLREYREHPEYYLPMTVRQYMTFRTRGAGTGGPWFWSAGILDGIRPYFAEYRYGTLSVITTAVWLSQKHLVRNALPLLKESGVIDADLTDMRPEYPFVEEASEWGGRTFRIIRIYMPPDNPQHPVRWLPQRCSFEELNRFNAKWKDRREH